jgi:integrase
MGGTVARSSRILSVVTGYPLRARRLGGEAGEGFHFGCDDMFLATGLRPGELLALQFSDVDFRMRTIAVTGTVKRDSVSGLHR